MLSDRICFDAKMVMFKRGKAEAVVEEKAFSKQNNVQEEQDVIIVAVVGSQLLQSAFSERDQLKIGKLIVLSENSVSGFDSEPGRTEYSDVSTDSIEGAIERLTS